MARKPKPAAQVTETQKQAPAVDRAPVTTKTEAPTAEAMVTSMDAGNANTAESTLGDGDATGAAAAASSASDAPEAPAPDVVTEEKRGPEGWIARVTGPAKGRWRVGRKFGPEPIDIRASELTDSEFARLASDPELKVELIEDQA